MASGAHRLACLFPDHFDGSSAGSGVTAVVTTVRTIPRHRTCRETEGGAPDSLTPEVTDGIRRRGRRWRPALFRRSFRRHRAWSLVFIGDIFERRRDHGDQLKGKDILRIEEITQEEVRLIMATAARLKIRDPDRWPAAEHDGERAGHFLLRALNPHKAVVRGGHAAAWWRRALGGPGCDGQAPQLRVRRCSTPVGLSTVMPTWR